MGRLTKAQKERLSPDALYFAGSMFFLMTPGEGELTFKMVESRPSDRSQAALDELVAEGLVSAEPFNRFGGMTYRPLVEFPRATKTPDGPWPVTVPIADRLALEANHE